MAGSKRILIVEDDQMISDMYARALEKDGYEVDFAIDGPTGIKKANAQPYDLILLDIMMPKMTGIEVLKKLRGDGKGLSTTKIVILTNLAQPKQSKEALESEADGYLIKADVVPSKLVEIVKQLI
jgi:two-component system OmpR family response regulator